MYSKFNCTDLTANFSSTDLTADSFMSADATTSSTSSVATLTKQLEDTTKALTDSQQRLASAKAIWDSCQYRGGAWAAVRGGAGFFIGSKREQSKCTSARDTVNAESTKIAELTKTIASLKESIDKVGSTDPVVIEAKGKADAAVKAAEAVSGATASRTRIIGYTIAAVILLAGITWAVVKLRKPKA